MNELVQTLSVFGALGVQGALRCSNSLFQASLYVDYSVAHWSIDPQIEQDAKTLFKTKATKYPFLQDEPLAESRQLGCSFQMNGMACEALGAAYLLNLPALSLLSDPIWNVEKISIQIEEINEDGEIAQFEDEINHAAIPSHVLSHQEWFQEQLVSPIKKGTDLWDNRQILFPTLEFCVEVENQLQQLLMPAHLRQVRIRLESLANYEDEWTSERMFAVLPDFSGESDTSLGNLRNTRIFRRSNGEDVFCEWHMKMKKTLNWRIHFYADFVHKKFIVGYVGPHLPI